FYDQQTKYFGKWAVVHLHAAVLWELDCVFCHTNASSKAVKRIHINSRRTVEALKAMFANTKDARRSQLEIPDRYTTDPQAEVLVMEPIPQTYIEGVYYQHSAPTGG